MVTFYIIMEWSPSNLNLKKNLLKLKSSIKIKHFEHLKYLNWTSKLEMKFYSIIWGKTKIIEGGPSCFNKRILKTKPKFIKSETLVLHIQWVSEIRISPVCLQMVQISNGIWNLEAQPFDIWTNGSHFVKNIWNLDFDWSGFGMIGTRGLHYQMPFPGNRIFPKKIWKISSSCLVSGRESFGNSQMLPEWKLII